MKKKLSTVELLRGVKKILSYHQSLGIENYPATPAIRHFLSSKSEEPKAKAYSQRSTQDHFPKRPQKIEQGSGPVSKKEKEEALSIIRKELNGCTRCMLHERRSHTVFGEGDEKASLFLVGEWPGIEDDREGRPFRGEPGELLDKMLAAIGLSRKKIFLTTIVKCCPKVDSSPPSTAANTCLPFLLRQIDAVSPTVICAMGQLVSQALLKTSEPLFRLRGRFHDFKGTPLIATYHPAFLIRNPDVKKAAWHDLQILQRKLNSFNRLT